MRSWRAGSVSPLLMTGRTDHVNYECGVAVARARLLRYWLSESLCANWCSVHVSNVPGGFAGGDECGRYGDLDQLVKLYDALTN